MGGLKMVYTPDMDVSFCTGGSDLMSRQGSCELGLTPTHGLRLSADMTNNVGNGVGETWIISKMPI